MLSINERLKIGKVYFDIQTEYKPSLGVIVGEILKDGRVLKKITEKRDSNQNLEDQVRNVHKEAINFLYQRISSAVKNNKRMANLSELRDKFVMLIKDSIPERNVVYVCFKIRDVKLEFKNGFLFEERVESIKRYIANSGLNTKLGGIEEIILKVNHYTAILLTDENIEFLLVVKDYRLGTASTFAERMKQKIKKEFYRKK